MRTPEAVEQAKSLLSGNLNKVVDKLFELSNFGDGAAKGGAFVFDDKNVASMSALEGASKSLAISDLELKLILNETNKDFYISDHPVFLYNWLHKNSSSIELTSIFSEGFQAFFPISQKLTICLYDSKVYKYGTRNSNDIKVTNTSDVDILNSFQFMNASSIVGFSNLSSTSDLKSLCRKFSKFKVNSWESLGVEEVSNSSQLKFRHLMTRTQLKLKRMPSFITVKRSSKSITEVSKINPALYEAFRIFDANYLEKLKNRINSQR